MGEFFKRCGIGVVVIVAAPLWIAYYALYVVFGILLLLFSPIRWLAYAIRHKKMSVKSEYDQKAEAILKSTQNPSPSPTQNQQIPGYIFSSSPTTSFSAQDVRQNNNPNPYQQPPVQPYQQPNYQSQPAYQPQPTNYPNPGYASNPTYQPNGNTYPVNNQAYPNQNQYPNYPNNQQPINQPSPFQSYANPNPNPQPNNNYPAGSQDGIGTIDNPQNGGQNNG
ncbi:MAG: hypothetical protein LKJ88_04085 [Bacilli bacterium]|jgi:hypothetical protein|nr:hypothetical protein [Bacilli bacterium]